MVLSEEMQSFVGVMLQLAEVITNMMNTFLPAISKLQTYLFSISDLNLVANNEFNEVPVHASVQVFTHIAFICVCLCLCDQSGPALGFYLL